MVRIFRLSRLTCIVDISHDNKKSWPVEAKRNWRAEADFADGAAAKHVDEICKKADGQQVKTFVACHWTLEYDLAYIGLKQQKQNSEYLLTKS